MAAKALQADGWILRSDVIWYKRNPMPESVNDRPTKCHEYIFLLSKEKKYYYDQDSIRVPYSEESLPRALRGLSDTNKWAEGAPGSTAHTFSKGRKNKRKEFAAEHGGGGSGFNGHSGYYDADGRLLINPLGRNKWTVWEVPTMAFQGAHFATYPEELIVDCVKAGSPEGGVVLDCFSGAGTTALVSRSHNRNFIACEMLQENVQMSEMRLHKELGIFKN